MIGSISIIQIIRQEANKPMNSSPINNLRTAFGHFTTGVTIVCASNGKALRGFTANSFASVSLNPPWLSVCLENKAQCMDVFENCDNFAVSVLAEEQKDLAHHFAYFQGDRFADINYDLSKLGSPVIKNCLAWFDCSCEKRIELGDHMMLIGRVGDFAYEDKPPLVYFKGDYRL